MTDPPKKEIPRANVELQDQNRDSIASILANLFPFVNQVMHSAQTMTEEQARRYKYLLWHTIFGISFLVATAFLGIALIIHGI